MSIPAFPHTAALTKSEISGDPIYGGSVAINRILHQLQLSASTPDKPTYSMALISIYTLVESNFTKVPSTSPETPSRIRTLSEVATGVKLDIQLLSQFFEAYAANGVRPRPLVLVFYAPTYGGVMRSLLRDYNESRKLMESYYQQIIQTFPTTPSIIADSAYAEQWVVPVEGSVLPHKELYRWIMAYPTHTRKHYYDPTAPHAILTHAPLDLHLTRFVAKLHLLERYTGKVKPANEFGTKLVKTGEVPFYSCTHRVFGDDVHIRPLVNGKARTELIAKIGNERWSQFGEETILQKLAAAMNMRIADLAAIKF